MAQRKASAEFVTQFATGWPQDNPEFIVLSLTTASGKRDFALTKDQALLIANTINDTAAHLPQNSDRPS